MLFQPARGTRDFLPAEMLKRNWVQDNVRKVFENYGYEPLGTPAFESWEMLKIKSGEDAINQIYYFKDKSDRELGLRFEWTASLARVVASHREIPKPFKRYAIGPVWRYERPSENSRREFWQMDADIVGVKGPIADTEILAVAVESLKRIGFEGFVIRLNERRLLEALIEMSGVQKDNYLDICRAIDKRKKIGDKATMTELEKAGASRDSAEHLMQLTSLKGKPEAVITKILEVVKDNQKGVEACEFLSSMVKYSSDFGIDSYIVIDLGLARGLDYYTGSIFEIYAEGYENYGSIAGGGRYDELAQLFGGEQTPMTGIAMGVARLVPILEKMGKFEGLNLSPSVYVVSISESVRSKAIELTQMLRRAGVSVDMDLLGRGVSRQLNNANRKGIRRAVIVGERELQDGCVIIRDMISAEQKKVKLENVLDKLLDL